jgi:hypothetical protein
MARIIGVECPTQVIGRNEDSWRLVPDSEHPITFTYEGGPDDLTESLIGDIVAERLPLAAIEKFKRNRLAAIRSKARECSRAIIAL